MKFTPRLLILFAALTAHYAGAQTYWSKIADPAPGGNTVSMIVAPNGNIIASGGNPVNYSTDNGATWSVSSGFSNSSSRVHRFVTDQQGTVYAASSAGVWKSTDNGITWNNTGTNLSADIGDIAFIATGELFAVGKATGFVFRSANNGATWDTVNTTRFATCIAANNTTLFVGTNNGKFYRSNDKGATWTQTNGTANVYPTGIRVGNNNTLFIGTEGNGILLSTDNGATWNPANAADFTTGAWISDLVIDQDGHIIISVDYVGVYLSKDNGATWTNISSGLQTAGSSVRTPNTMAVDKNGYTYAGTDGFGTYRSTQPSTGLPMLSPVLGDVNIFPNPTTGNLQIQFNSLAAEKLTVKVYDETGKEVARIMDEIATPGAHALQYDAEGLAAGTYYCEIAAASEKTVKRFVLNK
jgi:photosystem II stability/assembly factor-like uncharacterized protein